MSRPEALVEIGRGGSAIAYAGVDADGRAVVVKQFHVAEDPRARREAEVLAALPPGIAPALHASGTDDAGRPYLILEQVDGVPLAAYSDLPLAERVAALAAAARSVDQLHAAGVVHRDLKPAHLFVRADRPAAIIDFALASGGADAGDPGLTRPGERLGTAHYMAPEQCRGAADVDGAADRYALGVIAFELVTGQRPFSGSPAEVRAAHASQRPPRASAIAALPAAVDAVFARCLAKRPADRYPAAAAFVAALEAALRDTAASATPPAPRPSAAPAPAPAWQSTAVIALAASTSVLEIEHAAAPDAALVHSDGPRAVLALAPLGSVAAAVQRAAELASVLVSRLRADGPVVIGAGEIRARPGGAGWRLRDPAAVLAELAAAPARSAIWLAPSARAGEAGYAAVDPAVPIRAQPPLRGRDDLVRDLSAAAATGTGIALVVGEAGLGKTRLLAELASALGDAGTEVWTAPGAELHELLAGRAPGTLAPGMRRRGDAARALAAAVHRAGSDRRLAILVDDVHRADPIALDALQLAAGTVWVCAAGAPSFRDSRPGFAASERELSPLSDADSRALLRDVLVATEFVAEAVVARLARSAAGVPLYLVELAHALSVGGGAADDAVEGSAVPVAGRGARRALDAMPEALRQLCFLCAVLGDEIDPAVVERAQRAAGGDWIDVGVGLDRLHRAGLAIEAAPGRWRFRHPVVRRAIETGGPPARIAELHRAALDMLDAGAASAAAEPARIAAHGAGAGLAGRALAGYLAVAERARRRHAFVDAERAYTAALGFAGDDADRLRVLSGRAAVRYQSQRLDDAVADAAGARAIAVELGRTRDAIELCLTEAMIRDWMLDLPGAAAQTASARQLAGDAFPDLEPALLAAEGRVAYRAEDLLRAVDCLTRAADRAAAAGDAHTRTIALLLLAPSLLFLDRPGDAEARYREVVDLCEDEGDEFHLATAFCNRPPLWMRQGRLDLAIADLGRAVSLARRHGNGLLERFASHNLAEILYWSGDPEAARPLAIRSLELMQRFAGGHDLPDDGLLMARIEAARGDTASARAYLASVRAAFAADALAPTAHALVRLLDLVLDGGPADAWAELSREADELGSDLAREVASWAARSRPTAG